MPGLSKHTEPRDASAGPVENHSGEVGGYTIVGSGHLKNAIREMAGRG